MTDRANTFKTLLFTVTKLESMRPDPWVEVTLHAPEESVILTLPVKDDDIRIGDQWQVKYSYTKVDRDG